MSSKDFAALAIHRMSSSITEIISSNDKMGCADIENSRADAAGKSLQRSCRARGKLTVNFNDGSDEPSSLRRSLVRRTPFVRANPDCIRHRCATLRHIKEKPTSCTRLFVGRVFDRTVSQHVVAMSRVIALITVMYGTGEPMTSFFTKAFGM
jgi:hypothetical protein